MGSGVKRREGDNVRIAPQKQRSAPSSQGGSSSGSEEGRSSTTCPESFRIGLEKRLLIGARLSLKQEGRALIIYAGAHAVGRLNKTASERIGVCIQRGYRYEGTVKEYRGRQHAEFIRK